MTRHISQTSSLTNVKPLAIEFGGLGSSTSNEARVVLDAVKQSDLGKPFHSPILDENQWIPLNNLPPAGLPSADLGICYPTAAPVDTFFPIYLTNQSADTMDSIYIGVPNGYADTGGGPPFRATINQTGEQSFFVNGVEHKILIHPLDYYKIDVSMSGSLNVGGTVTFTASPPLIDGNWSRCWNITATVFSDPNHYNSVASDALPNPSFDLSQPIAFNFTLPAGTYYLQVYYQYDSTIDRLSNDITFTITDPNAGGGGGGGNTING